MKYEDGFHFIDSPCPSGKPDALILVLHGHHGHPEMFKDFPDEIRKKWPNADVLLVQGPIATNATEEHKDRYGFKGLDDLYTWHKVDAKDPKEGLKLAIGHLFNKLQVVDQLNKFADAQLAKRGLQDENLALFGFSLGGGIVVQMGTKRDNKCAAVVCHSGPVFPIIRPKSKPDTLLVMGDQDPLFYVKPVSVTPPPPPGKLRKAFDKAADKVSMHYDHSLQRLKSAKLKTEGEVVPGMSHTVNEASFKRSLDFMVKRLKK